MTKLDAELIMKVRVDCPEDQRLVVGDNDFGYLRAIMITGGSFTGKLSGKVLPGGADWNTGFGKGRFDGTTSVRIFAKYLLQTDDGELIAIENLGYRDKRKPEQPYIVTTPSFHAPSGKYEWLNYGVYVGSLVGSVENGVRGVNLEIYRML
ncbi:MAG: DUF3237 domain-containing protein [Lachnospiraceae bacterium]